MGEEVATLYPLISSRSSLSRSCLSLLYLQLHERVHGSRRGTSASVLKEKHHSCHFPAAHMRQSRDPLAPVRSLHVLGREQGDSERMHGRPGPEDRKRNVVAVEVCLYLTVSPCSRRLHIIVEGFGRVYLSTLLFCRFPRPARCEPKWAASSANCRTWRLLHAEPGSCFQRSSYLGKVTQGIESVYILYMPSLRVVSA